MTRMIEVAERAEDVADEVAAETGEAGAKPSEPKAKTAKHPGRRSVGWALVRAARLQRARLGDRLAALGLFPGQETVLQALAAEGPLSIGELAELLQVRPPTASKTVARLAALGLVARGSGGRSARVALTDEGQGRAEAVERVGREVERELLADFGQKERRRLRKLLRRAAENLVEAGTPETAEPVPDGA